jgi:hypothetical protein
MLLPSECCNICMFAVLLRNKSCTICTSVFDAGDGGCSLKRIDSMVGLFELGIDEQPIGQRIGSFSCVQIRHDQWQWLFGEAENLCVRVCWYVGMLVCESAHNTNRDTYIDIVVIHLDGARRWCRQHDHLDTIKVETCIEFQAIDNSIVIQQQACVLDLSMHYYISVLIATILAHWCTCIPE